MTNENLYYSDNWARVYNADALTQLKLLPNESINTCVTSPPYWGLRDYGVNGQLGLEKTPDEYVSKLVEIFNEVKRVLKKDGTLWLNLGDSYAGSGCGTNDYRTEKSKSINKSDKMFTKKPPQQKITNNGLYKPKDLIGIPWMAAFALRSAGWYLRMDNIWNKPNPMPESVKDRPTKSHEYMFLLSKSDKYYFDYQSILEVAAYDGRKDMMFKGGGKYKNTDLTFAERSHKRWVNKIYPDAENQTMHNKRHSGYFMDNGKELFYRNDKGVPARNKRSVWTVNTKPYKGAHFAVFPDELIIPCIKAGCPENGIVLDPFGGSGTTADVAKRLNRKCVSIELNIEYCKLHKKRWQNRELKFEYN